MNDKIIIKGAREHNLKNINLELPRNKIIVFTGLSGSGKSSLAFDTIFAEGQRRYIESLSAYARQFLGKMDKPDVDEIEGLSPAISIDQKSHSHNPRSTVATITEIYDYLRVLFARIGKPYCPKCGKEIKKMTKEGIVDAIIRECDSLRESHSQLTILAPAVRGRKGEYYQLLYDFLNAGFSEARIDGEFKSLRERIILDRYKIHTIELVADRIPAEVSFEEKDNRLRLAEAVETALKYGNDIVTIFIGSPTSSKTSLRNSKKILISGNKEIFLSAKFSCPSDGFSFPEIEPRLFSFNSPYGACEDCHGLGVENIWSEKTCPVCSGKRLKKESLNIFINSRGSIAGVVREVKKNISDVVKFSILDAYEFFEKFENKFGDATSSGGRISEFAIAATPLREIKNRLKFMIDVGLGYLTLDRKTATLSGGESQRIRLASQIGSRLTGALYILDEPTIGLHGHDNAKLIQTLYNLRDLGNTVIIVEHDEETIRSADYLVDIGPGAGVHGGNISAAGKIPEIIKDGKQFSLTLEYLRREKIIAAPKRRKVLKTRDFLKIRGASANNLKNINLDIPLRRFVAVTGVSGSGKSTLIYDVLYKYLANKFYGANYKMGEVKGISGLEYINRVINVDQSAIGRSSRSNPATYIGAWTFIRDLWSATEEARIRGYKPGRFSFNVAGGRCENCEGHGAIAVEMHFLPTVYVECDVCRGKRFDRETLEVKYKGKNIYDILRLTAEEGVEFFKDIPWLYERLEILKEIGLGYLELGQPAPTLSGGEAQRIKLSAELGRRDTRRTIYLLDEPTTGLHFADVGNLIKVLQKLTDRGNTVIVIEHNLDVIKSADWIIDLGPEGGDKGGEIVVCGTPEEVARSSGYTGKYLRKTLKM